MSQPVLIFAADELRGKIICKVLKRGNLESLVLKKMLGAGDAILKHAPALVVIDVNSCFPEEIAHLKNLCGVLDHLGIILLGDRAIISGFHGPVIREDLCLLDPLDPVLLVKKVKQVFAETGQEKGPMGNELEKVLKDVLKLH